MSAEGAVAAGVEAVRALVQVGVLECPQDTLGGFSVSWMRRALYGRCDHAKVSAARLEAIMARYGFVRRRPGSCVFELRAETAP